MGADLAATLVCHQDCALPNHPGPRLQPNCLPASAIPDRRQDDVRCPRIQLATMRARTVGVPDAMADSVDALYKTELHSNPAAVAINGGPWRGLDDLEIASCG